MKIKPLLCLFLFFVLTGTPTLFTHAAFLVDTGLPTSTNAMVIGTNNPDVEPGQALSLEFTLDDVSRISAIYPHLGRLEEGLNLEIWLTTRIGPETLPIDVMGSWTIWGIPGSETSEGIWYPIELDLSLQLEAGDYFLTYAPGTDTHATARWDAPIDHGRDFWASQNPAFPPASNFYTTDRNLALRIEGVPIPEPLTIFLFGLVFIFKIWQH